jgi:hypothetical protein
LHGRLRRSCADRQRLCDVYAERYRFAAHCLLILDAGSIRLRSVFALAGNLVVFGSHDISTMFFGRLLQGVGYLSLTVGTVTLIMRTTTGARRSIPHGL